MSGHVTDEIVDYLDGRLDPERREIFMQHLAGCAECKAAVDFALTLRETVDAQGLAHLDADRIVALAATPEGMTGGERAHLEACPDCRLELDWVTSRPGEPASTGLGLERFGSRRFRILAPVAALAAAAALLIVFLPARKPRPGTDLAALVHVEPLPVQITRGVPAAGSFEEARLEGLEAYRDGDYARAADACSEALVRKPGDAEMLLYRGSAELLTGRPGPAATDLEEGLRRTDLPPLREELFWQLASARLLLGDRSTATDALNHVIDLNGRRTGEARRLLDALGR